MGKGDPKGGRPRIGIDMNMLANMARIQCTRLECASILGLSESTIDRRVKEATGEGFEAFYKKHSDEGRMSLRRAQFKAATEDHQPTMLVWLGKHMLGQKDISRTEQTGADGGPIKLDSVAASADAVLAILKAKTGTDEAK